MEKVEDFDNLTSSDMCVGRSNRDGCLLDFTVGMKSIENHLSLSAQFKGPGCSVWTLQYCSMLALKHHAEVCTGKILRKSCPKIAWAWLAGNGIRVPFGLFYLWVTLQCTHQELFITQFTNSNFANAVSELIIRSRPTQVQHGKSWFVFLKAFISVSGASLFSL